MLYPNVTAYLAHLEANAEPLPNLPHVTLLQGTSPTTHRFAHVMPSWRLATYKGSTYGDWWAGTTTPAHVSSLINGYYHVQVM